MSDDTDSERDNLPELAPSEVPDDALIIDGGPIIRDDEIIGILDEQAAIEESDLNIEGDIDANEILVID